MPETLLITGTTSGVGLSLASYFASRFTVIAVGRNEEKLIELFGENPNVTTWRIDLSDPEEVNCAVERLLKRFGPIYYLISNAGVNIKGACEEISSGQYLLSQQVNAGSPLIILQKLLPGMKERNFGRVIHITSGAPFNCFPEYLAYSASKASLNAMTVTAAREYSHHNIKINLMSPGPVRSNMAPEAPMDPAVCHPTADYLLSLGSDAPTGRFFWLGYEIPLFPDLDGINWLEGKADARYKRVLP
jgi:NAD(P)-dependent dehydrogenase (short-subunit alcohol dehydrogenase family)